MRVNAFATVLLGATAFGCKPNGNVGAYVAARVVESAAPRWQETDAWQVGATPDVDIGGGVQEEYQLFRVAGALRMSDGTIVVANAGSAALRYYNAAGLYLGAGGRDGSGPGEFVAGYGPASVWRIPGNSVAAWDADLRRLSVFDARGVYGRSMTFPPESGHIPNPIGLLNDEKMVTVEYSPERMDVPMWKTYRSVVRYAVYSADGERLHELVELPGWEFLVSDFNGQRMHGPGPFGRISQVAVGFGRLYYTSADAFEVLTIDIDQDSAVVFRVLQTPEPVRARDIADYEGRRMANAPSAPGGREAWARWFAQVPYPETFPTFRGLTVDAAGNVWAQRYAWRLDSPSAWWIFDARGVWLGAVTLPGRFTPYDIGDTYVLGRWEDASGVEHVRLYELKKPRS